MRSQSSVDDLNILSSTPGLHLTELDLWLDSLISCCSSRVSSITSAHFSNASLFLNWLYTRCGGMTPLASWVHNLTLMYGLGHARTISGNTNGLASMFATSLSSAHHLSILQSLFHNAEVHLDHYYSPQRKPLVSPAASLTTWGCMLTLQVVDQRQLTPLLVPPIGPEAEVTGLSITSNWNTGLSTGPTCSQIASNHHSTHIFIFSSP